jgi:hypothetical protein
MSIATISNETDLGRASYSRVVSLMHLYEICCAERKRLTMVSEVIALEKRANLAAVGQANAGIGQYR